MSYESAFPSHELDIGQVRVVKRAGQQVAVFRLDDGSIAAVDNRCPHEGYPLSQGSCAGATLTCCYHNFKFDLRSGACLKGDEEVHVLPSREHAGQVQLDWTPPDPRRALDKTCTSFRTALVDARVGQALRDAARRIQLGVDPRTLLGELAADDGARSEYGATHVLPVCHDLVPLLESTGLHPVVLLSLPIEQICDTHARRPARPRAPQILPAGDFLPRLHRAIESEAVEEAEGLVRGALAAGWGRRELEPSLMGPVCEHFLDFGHAVIYQSKVFDLLDAVGWEHAPDVLAGHVVGIVSGTREDTLPGWSRWRRRLEALTPAFPRWIQQHTTAPDDLAPRMADASASEAVELVAACLDDGVGPESIARALVLAASERLLRFDTAIDHRRDVQDDWLSVTHILTFTEAVHTLVVRWPEAPVLRLLFMAARMVGHHRVLDGARIPWTDRPWDPVAFRDALVAQDRRALDYVTDGLVQDPAALQAIAVDHALGERFTRPIVVAHGLKLAVAGPAASRVTGSPLPTLAALRPLVEPVTERRVRRNAEEAIALVERGEVPKLLAP